MPTSRAAWKCSPDGFAAVLPLSGNHSVLAVGTMARPLATADDTAVARARIRSLLADQALLSGHDAAALVDRTNAALSAAGLGRVDALALVSRAAEGVAPAVVGAGLPLPLVVTPDRLSIPVEGTVTLGDEWALVLASRESGRPRTHLVAPDDVRSALTLLEDRPLAASGVPRRTLLAMRARA